MTIIIDVVQLNIIYHHAETIYPEECCGILIGKLVRTFAGNQDDKIVIEVIPTSNDWIAPISTAHDPENNQRFRPKHSRYLIAPQAIFTAQNRSRDLSLDIIGFFHSHPDTPAIPSECDRDRAWEVYSYPIVSVIDGQVRDLKSWVLNDQRIFQLESIEITRS